jgi:SNF2 family DNA or RNA helicase
MINYERLRQIGGDGKPSYALLIADFISNPEYNFSIIADESHRMKGFKTSEVMQILAPLTHNKMVLSGTPCPQSHQDLISQFRFLYPKEHFINAEDIAIKFQPIFVRTTKDDLKDELPKLREEYKSINYSGTLKDVHDLFKGDIINNKFNLNDRNDLRALGKIVIKLVRLCANPSLVLRDVYLINSDLADALAEEGMGPKINQLLNDARSIMHDGNKVIIWSSFPDSIDQICDVLEAENFFPVKIHGKIPMGDDKSGYKDPGTRRHAIHEFKTNPKCMAFVANPMAAGEGISLHHVCRHAFYADRSFNVAHYLQSKDRIHRIGGDLSKEVIIKVYALHKMIDSRVNERLSEKTKTMSDFLNDRSILTNFIDYDIDYDNSESEFLSGDMDIDLLKDDLKDVYNFLSEE